MCQSSTSWKNMLQEASSNVPLKCPICAASLLVTSKKFQASSILLQINDSMCTMLKLQSTNRLFKELNNYESKFNLLYQTFNRTYMTIRTIKFRSEHNSTQSATTKINPSSRNCPS